MSKKNKALNTALWRVESLARTLAVVLKRFKGPSARALEDRFVKTLAENYE